MSSRRRLGRLAREVVAALREHDVPLYAAGPSFYAAVALVPMLVVVLALASVALGDAAVRDLGGVLAGAAPDRHGLANAVRALTEAGVRLGPRALVPAVLVASLWGEGVVRALERLSPRPRRTARGLRGRVLSLLLVAAFAVLVPAALGAASWLLRATGPGMGSRLLGVYLAFLTGWLGATGLLLVVYRVFPTHRSGPRARLAGAAAAGSYLSGQSLGFLLVLSLPLPLGRVFAGSDALGTAALLGFWLYLNHVAVLVGYLLVLRLDARGRRGRPRPAVRGPATPVPRTVSRWRGAPQARTLERG